MLGTGPDSVAVLRKRGNPGTRRLEDGLRGDGLSKQGEKVDICSSLHIFFFLERINLVNFLNFAVLLFLYEHMVYMCVCVCV